MIKTIENRVGQKAAAHEKDDGPCMDVETQEAPPQPSGVSITRCLFFLNCLSVFLSCRWWFLGSEPLSRLARKMEVINSLSDKFDQYLSFFLPVFHLFYGNLENVKRVLEIERAAEVQHIDTLKRVVNILVFIKNGTLLAKNALFTPLTLVSIACSYQCLLWMAMNVPA